MHTGCQKQQPQGRTSCNVDGRTVYTSALNQEQQGGNNNHTDQWDKADALRVHRSDDQQRSDVVHHGEGDQKRTQLYGKPVAEHCENSHHKGGIRGNHHSPRVGVISACVEGVENQRGHNQTSNSGYHRHAGAPPFTQFSHHEVVLDFKAD